MEKPLPPGYRIAVALIIQLLYLTALFLFRSGGKEIASPQIIEEFGWHFRLLLAFSSCTSLLLIFFSARYLLLLFRISLFFLIAYPLGLGDEVTAVLLFALLTEIAAYLPFISGLLYTLPVLLVSFALGSSGSAFYLSRDATPVGNTISIMAVSALYSASLLLLRRSAGERRILDERIAHLNNVITQLSHANLDFQRYVHSVEFSAVNSERKRISREIHDTVGYSLTNILMTLEAATDLLEKDGARTRTALNHAIREAQLCIEETRQSMRRMRSRELEEAVGLQAIAHLSRSFSEATGMRIIVEYGNAPDSFGAGLDLVLFRIVQEGITNAFRHGLAGEVRIALWIEDKMLHVSVSDNGRGSKEIVDGVGLSGMRERVEGAGGRVSFYSGSDGFKVKSILPLNLKESLHE